MVIYRVITVVIKELRSITQDRQGRMLLIVPVLLQLAVFPFAATLEVKNNTLAVFDQDHGPESVELIQRLRQARAFRETLVLETEGQLRSVIDEQRALLVLRFAPGFSREVVSGQSAKVQCVLDGRRSNGGQIALGYVRRIFQDYLEERQILLGRKPESQLFVRHCYNPNLDYVRHIIPSLVAIITTISTLVITSLSVAREREQGTFDQLLVSPLTPGMIMVGKAVPALIVAMAQATVILSAGVFVYGIPFRGAFLLLYGCMVFYILALVGIGLLISSICSTQQQAFLGVFSFMMPAVLLSGFPSPVENMPLWMQHVDWFNPLRHFIVIVKGVFIKGTDLTAVWPNLWPLLVISIITLSAANWMFRRRIG